jgi:hypothetical protein
MTSCPALISAGGLRARLLELVQIGRSAEDGATRLSSGPVHEAPPASPLGG